MMSSVCASVAMSVNILMERCVMVPKRALNAPRVVLEKDKQLLVLQHQTVSVLKTIVLVPTVPLQLESIVPYTTPIFVRTVTMGFTKTALPVRTLTIVHQTHVATEGCVPMELVNTHASV